MNPLPTRITSPFNHLLTTFEARLNRWLAVDGWIGRVVVVSLGLSVLHTVLVNPSALWVYGQVWKAWRVGEEFDAFHTVRAQAATFYQDLGFSHFQTSGYATDSHLYKMRLRLLLPFLTATFGFKPIGPYIWLLQLVLSLGFVRLATLFAYRILRDRTNTLLFMVGFAWLYPVQSAWLDVTAYGDFFAFFLLLAAVYSNQPLAIFLLLQLAFWTDERALINALYVGLWHAFRVIERDGRYRITSRQIAVAGSGLLYLLLRYLLEQYAGNAVMDAAFGGEFLSTYYENFKVLGFRVWSGLLSEWTLVMLAVVMLLYQRRYALALWLVGAVFLTVNLSFVVYDVNRALSYGYLILFISLSVLYHSLSVRELRRILLFINLTMVFMPLPNRLRLPTGYTIM